MRRALVLGVAAFALVACGSTPTRSDRSTTYTQSIPALAQKAASIATDSCTTRPAVDAYPDCARFVAEVGSLASGAQNAGVGSTSARLADEVEQFGRSGCVAAPGVAGPPPTTCGDILGKIQADLKTLRTELAAKAKSS